MSASQPLPFLLRSLYHNIKLNVRKRYAGMEINMSDTTNLGEGSIGSLLAKLAVPAVVAQVVNLFIQYSRQNIYRSYSWHRCK